MMLKKNGNEQTHYFENIQQKGKNVFSLLPRLLDNQIVDEGEVHL